MLFMELNNWIGVECPATLFLSKVYLHPSPILIYNHYIQYLLIFMSCTHRDHCFVGENYWSDSLMSDVLMYIAKQALFGTFGQCLSFWSKHCTQSGNVVQLVHSFLVPERVMLHSHKKLHNEAGPPHPVSFWHFLLPLDTGFPADFTQDSSFGIWH